MDEEVDVMRLITEAMSKVGIEHHHRILRWAWDRYIKDPAIIKMIAKGAPIVALADPGDGRMFVEGGT